MDTICARIIGGLFLNKVAEMEGMPCRDTAARWLRKEGVPPWETAMQLGHKLPQFSMTERSAAWAPDYLDKPSVALEKLIRISVPLDAPKVPSPHGAWQLRAYPPANQRPENARAF